MQFRLINYMIHNVINGLPKNSPTGYDLENTHESTVYSKGAQ